MIKVVWSAAVALAISLALPAASHAADAKAAAYCVENGGVVQTRIPEYGTNGSDPLVLSGQADFCQFTAKDGSQINVFLSTLYTKKPTLAALAYYAKETLNDGCKGNPASCYCSQLGGSDLFGGISAAGGGWVLKSDASDVLEACIFPDLSSIDSWGLAYHSNDIIRGKNLAKVLRFKNPYDPARQTPVDPFARGRNAS
ncbi:MAG: hypothetical protein JO056_08535 [Alphaproteobacteria bacterium]|nr:hypothetical protein [Alphaproteobacteria bacterium]